MLANISDEFIFTDILKFADINNLANTTITKVPAVRAVTAKAVEAHAPVKHDDYPPGFGGGSALLDTYLQYIGENVFGESTKPFFKNLGFLDLHWWTLEYLIKNIIARRIVP